MTCGSVYFVFFALAQILLLTTAFAQSDRPLEGRKLRCCTLIESPMVFEDNTKKHSHGFAGIAIDYLNLLEDRLGFQCETLKLFKANKPENQGFTGFVYELEECTENGTIIDSPNCQCDIGVGGWVLNEQRMGRAEFPLSYINDDFRMLTHVDNVNFHSTSGAFFLTAFSTTTWIAIFGLLACAIFLKVFVRRFAPPDPQHLNLQPDASQYARMKQYILNSKLPERLKTATRNTLLEIIGQGTDDAQGQSQTTPQWCLKYILLLCGLFLVLVYEATMTAYLVQEEPQSDFRSINDLKSCRVPAEDVCIPAGGAALAFWEAAISKSPCNQGVPQPRIVDSYDEGHNLVANKQCKYFLASGATTRDAAHGRFCGTVVTTGEPFFILGSSYVLPKDSNLTNAFSNATSQLRVLDAVDSIDQYLRRRGECATGGSVSLTFGRLKMFFVMAYAAFFFMFIFRVLFPQGKRQGESAGGLGATSRGVKPSKDADIMSESASPLEKA